MSSVTVIIPLYNKEATVARAIESVLEQTFQDWRLIIVNDGSTDNSLCAAERFKDARISIFQQENAGPGAARNAGMKQANSDFVAFLDADDQWYPWYLENAVEAIRSSCASFVGTHYEDYYDARDRLDVRVRDSVAPGEYKIGHGVPVQDALDAVFFFHVGNTLIRLPAAKRYGGFYEEKCLLGEDTVFFARLVFNEPFRVIGPVAVRHNRHDSCLSRLDQKPIDIFLKKPEIIVDHCLDENKPYARQVLIWHAYKFAHFSARRGQHADAEYLLEQFPQMRQLGLHYVRLWCEIRLSRWLPLWVRLKMRLLRLVNRPVHHGKG